MDISSLGIGNCAVITMLCFLAGLIAKAVSENVSRFDSKWIPIVCGIVGGILGVPAMYCVQDFPAHDPLTAVTVGVFSGLTATGIDQVIKIFKKVQE